MRKNEEKGHPGNVGAHYQYLFMKELMVELRQHSDQITALVRQSQSPNDALTFQSRTLQAQKTILSSLVEQIKSTEWGRKSMLKVRERILQKGKELYEFETQRNYFFVEAFRESTNPPTVTSLPQDCYNLSPLYRICVNKELRRTIWLKQLINEHTKFEFFKYDHHVCPYNLMEELSVGLLRLSAQNKIRIKENQKDCALRILEYVIKKWDKIPTKSEQHLALGIVDLFAHYTPSKIQELGSIYVRLSELAEYYFEPDVELRMETLYNACTLVDSETFNMIKQKYLPFSEKKRGEGDLNEIFEHFRMTCTFAYFPLDGAQFIVDQLLIKKRNYLDIYILFSILLMIMSDDLEKHQEDRLELQDIIKPEITKVSIKLQDVVDAFRVIYEKIPIRHVVNKDKPMKQANHLLEQMIKYDELEEAQRQGKAGGGEQLTPEQIKQFVKIGNRQPLRLGNKI